MARTSPLDGKLATLIGGNGFIASHVAQDLLERGARVRNAARPLLLFLDRWMVRYRKHGRLTERRAWPAA